MKHEKLVKNTRKLSASIAAGEIESLRTNIECETSYRVYEGNMIGVAGSVGKCMDEELREKAVGALKQQITYPCSLGSDKLNVDERRVIIEEKDFLNKMRSLLARLNKEFPQFAFSNKVGMQTEQRHYTNSEGSDLTFAANNIDLTIVVQRKGSGNMMDTYIVAITKHYDEDKLIEEVREELEAFERKVELPDEELPVLMDSSLLQFSLGDLIAERYVSGAGIFAGKVGQKLFNQALDISLSQGKYGNIVCPFDAEGVIAPSEGFHMVKGGVLCGILTTKRSAAQFNLPLSGSAACSFDGVPQVGFTGFETAVTHKNIADICKKAIYVKVSSGGDITPAGDIGLPIQLAYLYENGKLVGRLPDMMLSGNIFEVMGDGYLGTAAAEWKVFDTTPMSVHRMKASL